MRIIVNRNNCQGKLFRRHTWGEYSYQQDCLVCGQTQQCEEAGSNPAPLGLVLILLVIVWLLT